MRKFRNVTTTKKVLTLICDACDEQATHDDLKFHEYICINQRCGEASIHVKGAQLMMDLCQDCFAKICFYHFTLIDEEDTR
ncbi:hypothetical protein [Colwellia sp. Bg11-28]|jgi:hypothetical protein|uniref:hypothetical protein n=1 Tax=Colwellia sp. Bg11-28 TaxID=2058305 RepID=UPI000C33B313|nr:hypothetical protein [Colwellia sp. Bg11-28]PKH88902.1 hypothetical protein CXF79_03180 [Colwellia sp. Bg11-28]